MKRSIVVMIGIVLLVLCSCTASKNAVRPLTKGISFSVGLSYYNETYACDAVVDSEGKATFTFTEPQALSGLSLLFENESVSAEYGGLHHEFGSNGNLGNAAMEAIYAVFHQIAESDAKAVLKNNDFILSDTLAGVPYTLSCGATGLPISLRMADFGLQADFLNVTIL